MYVVVVVVEVQMKDILQFPTEVCHPIDGPVVNKFHLWIISTLVNQIILNCHTALTITIITISVIVCYCRDDRPGIPHLLLQ